MQSPLLVFSSAYNTMSCTCYYSKLETRQKMDKKALIWSKATEEY